MTSLFFTYQIVDEDQQPLVNGSLYIGSLDSAKRHLQRVSAPNVAGKSNLEVVLKDLAGHEVWRGPYLGSGDA